MQVDFDSLGSYLHQERERQQVSLQEIAAATKIQLKFLEALEHDAYDQLPAPSLCRRILAGLCPVCRPGSRDSADGLSVITSGPRAS